MILPKNIHGHNRFLEEPIEPGSEYPGDQTQIIAYAPDGFNGNQNAAVGMVKSLTGNPTKPQVREACSTIEAALQSNTPALMVKEAHEVWDILFFLCMQYSGTLEEHLNNLLSKLEAMFPEEKF